MIGYDMDGVLAVKPPESTMKWGKMNGDQRNGRKAQLLEWYENAETLLIPEEPFIAISARRDTPETRQATENWLAKHQPNCVGLFLLPIARTVENVILFKGAVIESQGVTRFTEDNKKILRGLRKANTKADLWYYDHTMPEPERFVS